MLRILERYDVTHVLLPPEIMRELAPIRKELHLVFEGGDMILFRYRAD